MAGDDWKRDCLTFDMIRVGVEQFDAIKREDYPASPEYDMTYKSFLVGQIYQHMKKVDDGRS